jgi:hypothetical protein
MVQVYFDLGSTEIEGSNCSIAAEMVFDRYEGKNNERCVFKEHTSTGNSGRRDVGEDFWETYEVTKYAWWRNGLLTYYGYEGTSYSGGQRFDIPPYQVQMKSRARDSELPGLAFDSDKCEMSFEWAGMLKWFFLESNMLAKKSQKILTESMKWHEEIRDRTISECLAYTKKKDLALRNAKRMVRRHRIRKYYEDNHNWVYGELLFDKWEEDKAGCH